MEKCDSIDAMVRRNEIMPRCNSLSQIFKNNDYSQNLAKKDAVKTFKRSRHITFCNMNLLSLFQYLSSFSCSPAARGLPSLANTSCDSLAYDYCKDMCAIVIEPKVKEMLCHFKLGVYFYHFVKKTTTKLSGDRHVDGDSILYRAFPFLSVFFFLLTSSAAFSSWKKFRCIISL